MKIEELFGTLQMSVVSGWRKHLRSAKYGKHIALQEFYEEMPDKVDALIEAWMGAHGKKIGNFTNTLSSSNLNTLTYLKELKNVCKQGYDLLDDNEELESLLDDIVNLINSTLYKVKELSESRVMPLTEFINEALISEAKTNIEGPYSKENIEKYSSKRACLTIFLDDNNIFNNYVSKIDPSIKGIKFYIDMNDGNTMFFIDKNGDYGRNSEIKAWAFSNKGTMTKNVKHLLDVANKIAIDDSTLNKFLDWCVEFATELDSVDGNTNMYKDSNFTRMKYVFKQNGGLPEFTPEYKSFITRKQRYIDELL